MDRELSAAHMTMRRTAVARVVRPAPLDSAQRAESALREARLLSLAPLGNRARNTRIELPARTTTRQRCGARRRWLRVNPSLVASGGLGSAWSEGI